MSTDDLSAFRKALVLVCLAGALALAAVHFALHGERELSKLELGTIALFVGAALTFFDGTGLIVRVVRAWKGLPDQPPSNGQ